MRCYKLSTGIILAILLFSLLTLLSGCSAGNQQQNDMQLQALEEKKKEEKESEKLKKIDEQIENMFEILGGPSVKTDDSKDKQEDTGKKDKQQDSQQQNKKQQDSKQNSNQQDSRQDNKQQDSQQQDSQQKGGQSSQQQETQQLPDKWSQAEQIISELHYQWNELMPEIAKKGADMKLIDSFDNALNTLTTTIESKDKIKVLTSANKLYSNIPDLYSLYRTSMSPEVKRMIYYARNIILESDKNNWEQVKKDNESLEKSWSILRNTLEEEQKATGDKLDFSIYELKKVASEKNKQLTAIKGKVVLNNIKELQKSFEDK